MNDSDIRIFSSEEFIPVLMTRLSNNIPVNLNITGSSMVPFVAGNRDVAVLTPYKGFAKAGDILFYKRGKNRCVLHRVKRVTDDGIYFIGDAQSNIEGPVPNENILAECRSVIRKGKLLTEKNFRWWFFKTVWLKLIGIRQPIIRFISKFK